MYRCKSCREQFEYDEIYSGWCNECAKDAFTAELGFAYIEKERTRNGKTYTLESDFYINYLCGLQKTDDDGDFIFALDAIRTSFKSTQNPQQIETLMWYCLDDLTSWIDFLNERGVQA